MGSTDAPRNGSFRLLAILDTLGHTFTFGQWYLRFRPSLTEKSAQRTWYRQKAEWRRLGVPFEDVRKGETLTEAERACHNVVRLGPDARQVALRILGEADPDPGPEETHEEVTALFKRSHRRNLRKLGGLLWKREQLPRTGEQGL